jgi:hypothetical protein
LGLHPSVEALLTDLARVGPEWTAEQRERWVNTFLSNIDYAYPAKKEG